jgi:hypothetical protein
MSAHSRSRSKYDATGCMDKPGECGIKRAVFFVTDKHSMVLNALDKREKGNFVILESPLLK